MRKLALLLWIVALLATNACGATPTPTATPSAAATAELPTELPPASPTPAPTESPTEAPAPTLPATPPASALQGDTWLRPTDGMVMVHVPAGEFVMGSDDAIYNNERPAHSVTVAGFWLDRTEVTNAQYQACVEAGACKPPDRTDSYTLQTYYGHSAYADYPVISVNWYRALAYCDWVGGRLPTEAEWEYAARGPDRRVFPWGDMPDRSVLNYCDADCPLVHAEPASNDGYADTAPVGSFPGGASWVGALEMAGNVWEWVYDWFNFYPSPDNPAWLAPEFKNRVIRGGGWDTASDHARCTYRGQRNPALSHDSVGFRCAVAATSEP